MGKELLEIQPHELKFTFEVKKQSSCSIKLSNNSDQCVAFKVKTTCPRKYCARPNVGIIKPKAASGFTVTMQAQHVAPPDLQCKDKFLIQSIAVPFGTTDGDITSDMFAKDSGKYAEEKKLMVVLLSSPISPVPLPRNGELKQDSSPETSLQRDRAARGVENTQPGDRVASNAEVFGNDQVAYELSEGKNVQWFENAKEKDESREAMDVQTFENSKDTTKLMRESKDEHPRLVNYTEELKREKDLLELRLAKEFEELKLKLNVKDSQFREAEDTILKLTEARSLATREKDMLTNELKVLRRKGNVRKVQVGFPFLFLCAVALISLVLGYLSHP